MFALIVVLSLVTGGLSSVLCPTKVDPQVTVHLPHPTSCSKFLTCVGNHPVEQDCPAGLHWNVEQSFCDYPRASVCSRGELEPRPFNSTAVANSVCLTQTNQCPLNSNPSERVIFLKHRDCRKFYACVSTQQVELSCPPNLYWNSQSCVCDYEVDAECEQTDRPDDEVPEEADGEPEDVEDQQPAEEAEQSGDDAEQESAAPEEPEDQEPAEESADDVEEEQPEGAQDQEPAEESDPTVDEQPEESDAMVRVRRAADDSSSSSGSSGSSSGSDTSGSGTSGSGSSNSGSSGTGSSSTGTGSSGSTAQSGADIRAVSSIAVIAFTAAMSVL